MLEIRPKKTYKGYSWEVALQAGYELRKFGVPDEEINDILEKSEDTEKPEVK